jgi:hypothetical protein
MDELKESVAKGDQGKKSKALWSAFQVASEDRDLDYYRNLLEDHEKGLKEAEEAAAAAEEARVAAEAEKKAKKEQKKKSKDADGDVEMEDADGEKKKPTKKRKKEDGETDTPKVSYMKLSQSITNITSQRPR